MKKIADFLVEAYTKVAEFIKKHRTLALVAAFVIAALPPLIIRANGTLSILCRVLLYAILAGSLNAINGYSGQTCIGQAGFYCIGAYTSAILSTKTAISLWVILPIAGLLTAVLSLLITLPTMRMKGIYLSIVTLGFSEIVRLVVLNWTSLTGGPMGIKSIPIPTLFGMEIKGPRMFYYVYLLALVLFLFATSRIIKSRVGRAWLSIREDQLASKSLGVKVSLYKSINFMYGAFWAGIAGAIYAPYARYIDSTSFGLDTGWNIFTMVVLGGQGTLAGPILGSGLVTAMTELLRPIGNWRMVAYAILIITMMWVRPQGLIGAKDSVLAGNRISMAEKRARRKQEAQ